jgi:hypothetical protein
MLNRPTHRNVLSTIASSAVLLLCLACAKDPPASTTSTTGASSVNEGTANTVIRPNGANVARGAAPATTAACASCPATMGDDEMGHGQMGPGRMGAMNHGMAPGAKPMPMPMPDGGHMP